MNSAALRIASLAAMLSAPALAAGIPDGTYATVRVADGIYAFVPPEPETLVSGNSVAIIGDDGVLVVDSGHYPSVTQRMIADLRALTRLPVRFVVNTHWHYDHVMGNPVYAEEFPGVVFIAQSFTAEMMAQRVPSYSGQGTAMLTSELTSMRCPSSRRCPYAPAT